MKKLFSFLITVFSASFSFANNKPILCIGDTIPKITARPLVFENAFRNDPKFEDPTLYASFYTIEVGKIKIESGKLIACDASDMHNNPALTQTFPKGEFPVQLAMVKGDAGEAEYIAYTRILFSNNPVKKWSYAMKPGDIFREPSDSTSPIRCIFWGDMGMQTTVIADSVSRGLFIKKPHAEWGNVFVDRFKKTREKAFIHSFNDHNLVAVNTFFAPCYSIYIGYDDKGQPCRLLLDPGNFQIQRSLF